MRHIAVHITQLLTYISVTSQSHLSIQTHVRLRYLVRQQYNQVCNNISIVKPTRCTISQIYFILEQHYMFLFRTAFPSIIRSLRLCIQHQVCKQPQNLCNIYLMLYVQS